MKHVTEVAATCYFHLRLLCQIQWCVSSEVTTQPVLALVITRLDYCNAPLAGLPDYDRTTSASTKCHGMPGIRVGSKGARHSMSSPIALAACLLVHPVPTVLHYASSFQRKLPAVFVKTSFRQWVQADHVFAYHHPHQPTMCYHDFAPSSPSVPILTLVRLHGTDCLKTFAQNLTLSTFENFLKLTILILCLTFNNCILSS